MSSIESVADDLGLSHRAVRRLRQAGVETVAALAQLSDFEIADIRNVGVVTALEIARARATASDRLAVRSANLPTYIHGDQAVADFLGVTSRTVANMVARGDLTQYRIAGVKGNRYLLSDVVALVTPVEVVR